MKEEIRRGSASTGEGYEKVMPPSCLLLTVTCPPLVDAAKRVTPVGLSDPFLRCIHREEERPEWMQFLYEPEHKMSWDERCALQEDGFKSRGGVTIMNFPVCRATSPWLDL